MKHAHRLFALLLVLFVFAGSIAAAAEQSDNIAVPGNDDTIYIGIVCARTGTAKLTGELNYNGAQLAADQINEAGGILGKKIELVVGDEIDNMQASVNATNRLLNDERITAIIGTNFSQNVLAVLDAVEEHRMPYIACGSNDLISQAGNPYVWQPRNFDNLGADILAKFAYETLGIKNPAIMYSTIPNCAGPGERIIEIYKNDYGIEIPDSQQIGYAEEETNFAPIIAQIKSSGADGLIHYGNQQPDILISKAIADAGLTIPRVANAAVASAVVIENAGKAADGWYSTCDWSPEIDNEVGQAFQNAYYERHGMDTEMLNAVTYDGVYLIKEVCEIAGTTVDREAINEAFKQVDGFQGVLGTYKYHEDHSFLSEFYVTQIQDGKAVPVDLVKYR